MSSPPADRANSSPASADRANSTLRRRRQALAEEVAELHWDLGGLTYEMAIRDHFRLDLLVRRAALLQERDAELAEIERLLRLEDGASAGSCSACGAPHSRGAGFCWQCGTQLIEHASAAKSDGHGSAQDSGVRTAAARTSEIEDTLVMDPVSAPD